MTNSAGNGRSTQYDQPGLLPPVLVEPDAYGKLQTYVNGCDVEISGLGIVDYVDGELIVRDVFLLPQRCTSGSTDIAEEDMARFLDEFVTDGGDPQRLRLHWHSHARSAVFWSGVDRDTQLNSFAQADWYVFLVLNHAGASRAALHVNGPVPGTYDPLPVRLWIDPSERQLLQNEVATKVQISHSSAWYTKVPTGWTVVGGGGEAAGNGWDGDGGHEYDESADYLSDDALAEDAEQFIDSAEDEDPSTSDQNHAGYSEYD